MNDLFHIKDYVLHWWKGDVATFYRFIGLEVPQANKVFKIGLYLAGLAAIFDLYKFEQVVESFKDAYYSFTFSIRLFRNLTNFLNISIRCLFIPAYYIMSALDNSPKMKFSELIKFMVHHHIEASETDAKRVASKKWTYKLLNFLQHHPPTDRQIKISVFCSFLFLAALELFTAS